VTAIEPVQLYRHCLVQANAPWGLSRLTARSTLPSHGPYSYTYPDKAVGEGVVAYVVDTGINIDHVEFEGRATRGEKFATSPLAGSVISDDDLQGHGTHCAGTIAGRTYGVAKKVDVVGVKVFNDFDEDNHPELAGAMTSDIIAALQWIIAQVNEHGKPSVVNMSLGGGISAALDNAVAAAVRSGIVVCVAAGNTPVCTKPTLCPYEELYQTIFTNVNRNLPNEARQLERHSLSQLALRRSKMRWLIGAPMESVSR
jgi:subtilisin family serine protease